MTAGSVSLDQLRRIGVIGAGQMGAGIAHVCALAGFEVALTDIGEEALQRGREAIDRNLARQVARGKITGEDKAAALGRIRTGAVDIGERPNELSQTAFPRDANAASGRQCTNQQAPAAAAPVAPEIGTCDCNSAIRAGTAD